MNESRTNENEMMQNREAIEESAGNVVRARFTIPPETISEVDVTEPGYRFGWGREREWTEVSDGSSVCFSSLGDRANDEAIEIQKEKRAWEMLERTETFLSRGHIQDMQVRACGRHVEICLMGRTLSGPKVWRPFFIINANESILTYTRNRLWNAEQQVLLYNQQLCIPLAAPPRWRSNTI